MDQFISQLLQKAKAAGIEPAEVYYVSGESFRAMCQQGMIANYTVNSTRGLSLRGIYGGKMGYASTQAFDEDAADQLVSG
ncbi:MAG: TldD/PmbA family protein, partial [Clostridia bacterium]|nr:TldD/PmbA family protein [Clostridia bacterium]